MRKIYCFITSDDTTSLTLDEFQEEADFVTLMVNQRGNVINVRLERDDFNELCNMRYRLDFARDIPAQLQELTLVAA